MNQGDEMLDSFDEILGGLGDLEKIDAKGIREHNMAEHLKARMVRKGRMSSMGHENDPDEPVAEQICELIRELDDADRRCEESVLVSSAMNSASSLRTTVSLMVRRQI